MKEKRRRQLNLKNKMPLEIRNFKSGLDLKKEEGFYYLTGY